MNITRCSHYLFSWFQLLPFLGFCELFFLQYTSRLFQPRHLFLLRTDNTSGFLKCFCGGQKWELVFEQSSISKQPAERNGECAASESSDSLGASPGPSSALCPLQVSNIQRESRADRQTDGKYVIKRRKKSLSEAASESGQHLDPTEASASPGASFGTSGLTMSFSSSYVTLPGGPLPSSPGTPL